MDIFFADDARQRTPSRPGMGPLVAAGGIHVPGDAVRPLETGLNDLCAEFGFPAHQEFKWSPGRELWMHENLVGEDRKAFLIRALQMAAEQGVKATVVIEDTSRGTATPEAETAEDDVVVLVRVPFEVRLHEIHRFHLPPSPGRFRRGGEAEKIRIDLTLVHEIGVVLNLLGQRHRHRPLHRHFRHGFLVGSPRGSNLRIRPLLRPPRGKQDLPPEEDNSSFEDKLLVSRSSCNWSGFLEKNDEKKEETVG